MRQLNSFARKREMNPLVRTRETQCAGHLLWTIVLCCGCGQATPQAKSNPDTAKAIHREKKVVVVLDPPAHGSEFFARLIKTYRDAPYWQVEAEYDGALLAPLDNLVLQTIRYVRPDKLAVDHQDGRRRVSVQSDGKQYGLYSSSVRQYVSGDAPKQVTDLVTSPNWKSQVGDHQLFLWRLLAADADQLPALPTVSYVKREKSESGATLDHGQFVQDGWQYDVWSSTAQPPVLVKVAISPAAADSLASTQQESAAGPAASSAGSDRDPPSPADSKAVSEDSDARPEDTQPAAKSASEEQPAEPEPSSPPEPTVQAEPRPTPGQEQIRVVERYQKWQFDQPISDGQFVFVSPKKASSKPTFIDATSLIGQAVPKIDFTPLDGKKIPWDKLHDGRNVVIYFWGTWSGASVRELAALPTLRRDHWFKGWGFYHVAPGASSEAVRAFLLEHQLNAEGALLDEADQLGPLFEVSGLPMLVSVDTAGIIRDVRIGADVTLASAIEREEQVQQMLTRLDREPDPAPALSHADDRVRRKAASLLAARGATVIPQLGELLFISQSGNARKLAVNILESFGRQSQAAMPSLLHALADDESGVRSGAVRTLAGIGPPAVNSLIDALGSQNPLRRAGAAQALGEIGSPAEAAVPALLGCLQADENWVRESAQSALARVGPSAIPALVDALVEDDARVKSAAEDSLVRMNNRAVPALADGLERPELRNRAAGLLRRIGTEQAKAALLTQDKLDRIRPDLPVADLVALLGEPEPRVQQKAIRTLVNQGEPAVAQLIESLGSPDRNVRRGVAQTLVSLGAMSVPALTLALNSGSDSLRGSAAQTLGAIGPEAKAAIGPLLACFSDRSRTVRDSAVRALGNIGEPAVEPLIGGLASEDQQVQSNASAALALIGGAAVPGLTAALKNENPTVRIFVASTLGEIGPAASSALEELNRVAEKDPDNNVRTYAVRAVRKIDR